MGGSGGSMPKAANEPDREENVEVEVKQQPSHDRKDQNRSKDANVVGSYELGRALGKGQFGIVKAARHCETGAQVAIKIVEKRIYESEEIRIQRMLDHTHLVKVHEVFETDSCVYIVMDHASGGDLFDYLVKHTRVKEDEARRLFQQIIEGVDHCHASGIVHRDLKAENILLDENQNVKIADFGLAAEVQPGELLTKSCGSPNYAAPELLSRGCRYRGPEVDVWSCGVILFALLTIKLPFDAPEIPELFRLIKRGRYSVPGYVSTDAKDLLKRMLTVNPDDRITTAEIRKHKWFSKGLAEARTISKPAKVSAAMQEMAGPAMQPMAGLVETQVDCESMIFPFFEESVTVPRETRPVETPLDGESVTAPTNSSDRSHKVTAKRLLASAEFKRKDFPDFSVHLSASCGTTGLPGVSVFSATAA